MREAPDACKATRDVTAATLRELRLGKPVPHYFLVHP
jgi:hypothetical protein